MTSKGCVSNCNFCSERVACGAILSKPKEKIMAEFRKGLKAGYRTFALVTTDLGAYGRDLSYDLCDLLGEMTEEEGDYSVLILSVNPVHLKMLWDKMLPVLEKGKVIELGVAAQCGSDRLLRMMGRGHTTDQYESMIRELRHRFPRLFLTTQLMVGFPTEGEEDFRSTLGLIDRNLFDHIDVFKYSNRPTVSAAKFIDQVPESIARKRYRQLIIKASLREVIAVQSRRGRGIIRR